MNREEIFKLISDERDRQDCKWGKLPRWLADVIWLAVLVEEVGECAKAILKQDWSNLRIEAVQVAAVAVAWMEDAENHDNGLYKVG